MNTVLMNQFGSTLTDREDGKKVFQQIAEKYSFPVILDFQGVVSLGSSFGEEIILKIAPLQNNEITICNTNDVIKNSVKRIVEDVKIDVTFNR
jgi:anti-anti-sigma regulatory factor